MLSINVRETTKGTNYFDWNSVAQNPGIYRVANPTSDFRKHRIISMPTDDGEDDFLILIMRNSECVNHYTYDNYTNGNGWMHKTYELADEVFILENK